MILLRTQVNKCPLLLLFVAAAIDDDDDCFFLNFFSADSSSSIFLFYRIYFILIIWIYNAIYICINLKLMLEGHRRSKTCIIIEFKIIKNNDRVYTHTYSRQRIAFHRLLFIT
jgi:hypothetical protein